MSSEEDSNSNVEFVDIAQQNAPKPREMIPVNDISGMQEKLREVQLNLDWVEKLDIIIDLSQFGVKDKVNADPNVPSETKAESDFKREMAFYNQAKAASVEAIHRLKDLGIPTKRPVDYFAEMVKSDEHMVKVREKLLSKQMTVERTEKAKELRSQKKHGKKIQQEVLQQRKKDKKHVMDTLKRNKKEKFGTSKMLENKSKSPGNQKPKGKRFKDSSYKDKKYGYGGKKKGSKYNTADSSSFQSSNNRGSFSKGRSQGGKGKPRPKSTRRRR